MVGSTHGTPPRPNKPKSMAQLCKDQVDPYAAAATHAIYTGKCGFVKVFHFADGSCLSFQITYTATKTGMSFDQ